MENNNRNLDLISEGYPNSKNFNQNNNKPNYDLISESKTEKYAPKEYIPSSYNKEMISKTIKIAWESQRSEIPETIEGKILHDAHVLEGGKTYLVVKTLITGSVRGQSLIDTLKFMERNVLNKNNCYLPETIPLCEEMNKYTNSFFEDITEGIK